MEGRNLSNTKRFRPFLYLLALKTSHYHQKRRREKRRRPPSLSSLPNSRIRYSATAFLLDVRPEIDSASKKKAGIQLHPGLSSRCDKGTFLSLSGNTPSYPKRTDRESITPKMFERGGIGKSGEGRGTFSIEVFPSLPRLPHTLKITGSIRDPCGRASHPCRWRA